MAVVDIALYERERPVRATYISERNGLAPRYLEPVLQSLVQYGILVGFRGNLGGYRIAQKKSAITVADIVLATVEIDQDEYRKVARLPAVVKIEEEILDVLANINVEQLTKSAGERLQKGLQDNEPGDLVSQRR